MLRSPVGQTHLPGLRRTQGRSGPQGKAQPTGGIHATVQDSEDEAGAGFEPGRFLVAPPRQNAHNDGTQANTLYYGDNLQVLREHVPGESVDLIYLGKLSENHI